MAAHKVFKPRFLRICLNLQFPPFSTLFRLYYFLAIKLSVFLVARIENPAAIYVSGSIGGGRAIYGLSDIDLNLFFRGPESAPVTLGIRNLFRKLKLFFPMLGSPEEKGIYFLESFADNYQRYPMIRHLFDNNFYPQKLVRGEDILGEIRPEDRIGKEEKQLRLIWKLRYWLEKIVIFSEASRLTEIQLTHLYYKAVLNILAMCEGLAFPVGKGLPAEVPLGKTLVPEVEKTWQQLQDARENLYLSGNPSSEDCYSLFKFLLQKCLESRPAGQLGADASENEFILEMSNTEIKDQAALIREIKRICGEHSKVKVLPFCHVPIGLLDTGSLGLPAILVSASAPLSLQQVHDLRILYKSHLVDRALLLVRESEGFFYSVHPSLLEHWIYEPRESPCLFSSWNSRFPRDGNLRLLQERLAWQADEIERLVDSDKLLKISRDRSWRIIFAGIQRMILFYSLRERLISSGTDRDSLEALTGGGAGTTGISVPCDPHSVVHALQKLADIPEPVLKDLVMVADREFPGPEACPSLVNGIRLLQSLARVATGQVEAESLSKINPQPGLRISVVIVTRNRARYLEGCLKALRQLSRKPEEIIVIDNGSSDETASVIEEFAGKNPVRYIYEEQEGISRARNTGVKAATGEIVAFVDDDAMADPDWLSGIEAAFLENPEVGIVGGAIHTLVEEDRHDWTYSYHCDYYRKGEVS